MKIWDLHCHLAGFPGRTPDEAMARLMGAADRMGIERVIVYMGTQFLADPSPDDLRRQNDQVLQALAHWRDRAFGFVYVSLKHVDVSLNEIDRCVRDGPMVGLKLWVARRCDCPEGDAVVKRAEELRAVIFQHTWIKSQGNQPGESSPSELAALAKRHPGAAVICGHTGGQWERGIRAVRDTPNVSIDLAGSDPTAGFVEMAVRELGPRRVIYGSDAPGRSFASQVAKVYGANVSDEVRQMVFAGNLRRLLTPILTAKGVKV
jgi:predicted TIM-barrel fold metal-dependent hydrolase